MIDLMKLHIAMLNARACDTSTIKRTKREMVDYTIYNTYEGVVGEVTIKAHTRGDMESGKEVLTYVSLSTKDGSYDFYGDTTTTYSKIFKSVYDSFYVTVSMELLTAMAKIGASYTIKIMEGVR